MQTKRHLLFNEEALQQIGKDFPAHYRDVIEQYFRKLATDSNDKNEP